MAKRKKKTRKIACIGDPEGTRLTTIWVAYRRGTCELPVHVRAHTWFDARRYASIHFHCGPGDIDVTPFGKPVHG